MRSFCLALCGAVLLTSCGGNSDNSASGALTADSLVGEWDVALYFDPNQPPSSTEMIIRAAADGQLIGSFYQSEFEESGYTVFEEEVLFTVQTSDNSGPYLTSGRLAGDCIDGQTLSTGRDFLMAWKACPKTVAE